MSLFLELVLAHLLGDFVLQPNQWVIDKKRRMLKSPFLYLHGAVHGVLIMLLTASWEMWPLAMLVGGLHICIDAGKLLVASRAYQRQWPFFVDQFLHVFVLISAAMVFGDLEIAFPKIRLLFNLKIVTAYLFVTLPTAVIIDQCLASWQLDKNNAESLPKAGKIIGIIERLLVVTFILFEHWEAIGFLITAKSVFRFNDLKLADRKLTEYILIGTLLSFGIAVFTGILLRKSLIPLHL